MTLTSQHKFNLFLVPDSNSKSNTCSISALERLEKYLEAAGIQPQSHYPKTPIVSILFGFFLVFFYPLYTVDMILNFVIFERIIW